MNRGTRAALAGIALAVCFAAAGEAGNRYEQQRRAGLINECARAAIDIEFPFSPDLVVPPGICDQASLRMLSWMTEPYDLTKPQRKLLALPWPSTDWAILGRVLAGIVVVIGCVPFAFMLLERRLNALLFRIWPALQFPHTSSAVSPTEAADLNVKVALSANSYNATARYNRE